MSAIRDKIDISSHRATSPHGNILYFDSLHRQQFFLDGLRQRRRYKNPRSHGGKIRGHVELLLVVAASFALIGLFVWTCI